jgi:hypothetical protein
MKLAEALVLRADYQKRLEQLKFKIDQKRKGSGRRRAC